MGIVRLNPMQTMMMASTSAETVLIAPTGSGKTLAFACAMLRGLKSPAGRVQAVVVAPSRELALQIFDVVRPLARGFKTTVLRGGTIFSDEASALSVCPDIVISTPGRLLDHIRRSGLDVSGAEILVIDEYDKMLDLGFADEMRRIVTAIGHRRRLILTSATMPGELPPYLGADRAETIVAEGVPVAGKNTHVMLVESPARDKLQTLDDLLRSLPDGKTIVFVNHRESAERVFRALAEKGLPVGLYHGGMEQRERETALALLDNYTTPILVSTDLASRGLDIERVDNVVHYHLPPSPESWTHRNGRTARMGAGGNVYVIVSEADSIPDYVVTDTPYVPSGKSASPIRRHSDTLYFAAGKKEKISRGDILGFILAHTALEGQAVGRIVVKEHSALAAVPAGFGPGVAEALSKEKLKGHKVRVSVLEPLRP